MKADFLLKFSSIKKQPMQDTTPNSQLPRIGLTQGDFNGISYEIMLKAFSDARMFETFTPVLYGQSKAFAYYKKNFGMDSPNYTLTRDARQAWDKKFNIINIVENELKIEPGVPSEVSAEMAVLSMKKATDDLQNGYIDALVMAPDSPAVAKSNRDFLLSFHKDADPMQVSLAEATELIKGSRQAEQQRHVKTFKEDTKLEVMNGRYGPYLTYDGKNYRLPKAMHDKAKALTYEECMKIIEKGK